MKSDTNLKVNGRTLVRNVEILDCTVRDGGYVNDNRYSLEAFKRLVIGSYECGISKIEVGHGLGVGADRDFSPMAFPLEEYLECLERDVEMKRVGVFALPRICTTSDIKRIAACGIGFIRIGFIGYDGPHPYAGIFPLLAEAKALGLWTSVNIVKSHMYTLGQLAAIARECVEAGCDNLSIVDSAGHMLPRTVRAGIAVLIENGAGSTGFHGHQNLDLAVANSLEAVAAGAKIVDGTLLGVGRDAGNAQLEILGTVLESAGYKTSVNLDGIYEHARDVAASIFPGHRGVAYENLLLGRYGALTHAGAVAKQLAEETGSDYRWIMSLIGRLGAEFETRENMERVLKACVVSEVSDSERALRGKFATDVTQKEKV